MHPRSIHRIAVALACVLSLAAPPVAGASVGAEGDLLVSVWQGTNYGRNLDLALLAEDGSGTPRFLTRSGLHDHSPSWSPTGDRIVFARRGAKRGGIHLLRGSMTFRLTRGPLDGAPAFSPDGTRIAFSRASQVLVMRADGQGQRLVVRTHLTPRQLSWTPDGTQLYYSDDGVLRTVDVATGAVTTLPVSGVRPALSRDGSRVAYMASGSSRYFRDSNWGLHVGDSSGANAARVVAGQWGPLSWSRSGDRLLVTNGQNLAFVDVASQTLTPLRFDGAGGAFKP